MRVDQSRTRLVQGVHGRDQLGVGGVGDAGGGADLTAGFHEAAHQRGDAFYRGVDRIFGRPQLGGDALNDKNLIHILTLLITRPLDKVNKSLTASQHKFDLGW